jgi:hypothetical protein
MPQFKRSCGKLTCLILVTVLGFSPPMAWSQTTKVSSAVTPFVEKGALTGAVMLVAEKEKTLAIETAGYLDVSAKQPIPANRIFWRLGWAVGDGWLGHGGALATNTTVDRKRGIATVWLIQHAGFPQDGDKAHGALMQSARQFAISN